MSEYVMRLRTNLIWFPIIAFAAILYIIYATKNAEQRSEEVTSSAIEIKNERSESIAPGEFIKSIELIPNDNTTSNPIEWNPDDQAQKEQLLRWKAERGWHDMLSEDLNGAPDYRTYSKETLERLGEQGDLRALHALVRLPISPAERQSFLTKAAVHGSTFALFQLANAVSSEPNYEANPTEERKRQAIIEALAYVEVARMRGEGMSVNGKIQEIQETLQFSPTKPEVKLIETRTQEIYNDLADQRRQMGLPEFDNSTPPVVKAFERYMQQ